jgi:hypothetical protein
VTLRKKAAQDRGATDRAGSAAMVQHRGRRWRWCGIKEEVRVGDDGGIAEQGRADSDGRVTAGRVGAAPGKWCRCCTTSVCAAGGRGRRQ